MAANSVTSLWSRIKSEGRMVWALLKNPDAPIGAKAIAVAALAYLISPVDFISDLFPLLGWLDDAVIVSLLLWLSYRLLPRELYEQLRQYSQTRIPGKTPRY